MVDINRVYQRVLFIANKEQRGYITPDEFNSFADQAQKEVFESYFLKQFQTNQAPGSTEDYGNPDMLVEEKIALFDQVDIIEKSGDLYELPINLYRLDHVSVRQETLNPDGVTYTSTGFPIMADEVSHRDIHYINLSPLTQPTSKQPVYLRQEGVGENGAIRLFPESYNGRLDLSYLRQPVSPMWMYMDSPTGEPIYNQAASQDFEVHPGDEQDLVYKILTLAGVAIKQQDVASFGQGKDSQIAATEV